MGAEVLALTTAGMGIAQGFTQQRAYNEQAGLYERDAALLESESIREGARIEDEGKRFADEQKMAYIGSGVEIGGSAVVTLAQTDKWAATEAEAVRERGRAVRDYQLRSAKIARGQGRAAFVSGVLGGLAEGYGIYSSTKAPGTAGKTVKSASDNAYLKRQTARSNAITRMGF